MPRARFHEFVRIVVVCLSILVSCSDPQTRSRASGTVPREPLTEHVFVVGWDGADWKIVQPLLQRGELPNLARLIESGAAFELETIRPTRSPVLWTSIATGVSPEEHGILDFVRPVDPLESLSPEPRALVEQLNSIGYLDKDQHAGLLADQPTMRFYRSSDRRVGAIWNRFSEHGLRSLVLGWWVTYPAEVIHGRIVSDRYCYERLSGESVRRNILYDLDGPLLYPEAMADIIETLVIEPGEVREADLARFASGPLVLSDEVTLDYGLDELRIAYARDESFSSIADRLLEDERPELLLLLLKGADIGGHYFWKHRFPDEWGWVYPDDPVVVDDIERYGKTLDAYYEYLDEKLGALLRYADERTTVLVVSDHGMVVSKGRHTTSWSGDHVESAPPGILVVGGSGVQHQPGIRSAHIYDVAPTVHFLLGVPYRDMEGRALDEVLGYSIRETSTSTR